ncbi:hypothetical protein Glove_168g263 [Diversispora epigaea]|uniref:Uncharacterized protein n=1 Tax=Diversispora epigaea TaxID=1348612 RepID=A0A397IWG5_9GLOM|nr:hypothetical protein Glove_168g263 [Diversispora epigaea]
MEICQSIKYPNGQILEVHQLYRQGFIQEIFYTIVIDYMILIIVVCSTNSVNFMAEERNTNQENSESIILSEESCVVCHITFKDIAEMNRTHFNLDSIDG